MSVETAPKLPPKPSREQARVLYPYEAQNEDELTINEGDIINVLSKEIEDQGWFKGELNGKVGVFPDNFVELIRPSHECDDHKPPPPRPAHVKGGSKTDLKSSTVDGGSSSKLNGGSKSESKTPTILTKILGGPKKSSSPASASSSATTATTVPSIYPNLSASLSSSPKQQHSPMSTSPKVASKGGPPDVVPHSDNNSTSHHRLDMMSRSLSSASASKDEENETITDLETNNVSKLLTNPSRPKGPTNRRPPSYIAIIKDESGLENGSSGDNHKNHDTNNGTSININKNINNNDSSSNKLNSPSSNNKISGHNSSASSLASSAVKPKVGSSAATNDKDKDADTPPAPWMIELRKTQELKRGGSRDVQDNSVVTPTTETEQKTLPSSTAPGIVPRPTSTVTTTLASSVVRGHRASGDFTARRQALLMKDGSFEKKDEDANKTPSVSSDSSPTINNKPIKPMNKPSAGSSPSTPSNNTITNSNANFGTSSAVTGSGQLKSTFNSSVSSSITTSNNNNINNNSNNHSTTPSVASSKLLASASASSSDENILKQDATKEQLDTLIQKEIKSLKETMVTRKEFDDVIKQLNELKSSFESYKTSKKLEVKELINEIAEEKTKVATLQIEVDRLRKLSTTV